MLIGSRDVFAIEFQFLPSPNDENNLYEASWGFLRLWIEGEDICQFTTHGKTHTYTWNLLNLLDWLIKKHVYFLGHDPFPVNVPGSTLHQKLEQAYAAEITDQVELDLWFGAVNRWTLNHNWFFAREGAYLSQVFFCRTNNDMEIAWLNDFWSASEVQFPAKKGSCTLPYTVFKTVFTEFFSVILAELRPKAVLPEDIKLMEEWKAQLIILLG